MRSIQAASYLPYLLYRLGKDVHQVKGLSRGVKLNYNRPAFVRLITGNLLCVWNSMFYIR
jgi:hypothetical protein